jgi:hypothetical protein
MAVHASDRLFLSLANRYFEATIDGDWEMVSKLLALSLSAAHLTGDAEFAALAVAIHVDFKNAWPPP